jgi:lipoyl(octanoyl) transferase
MRAGHLVELHEPVPYLDAWELQRSVAAQVASGERPDTVLLLEHAPVITLGRRTEAGELHVPVDADVDIVETDRGGKSTYHGPGQLVCYPIFDLTRHGQDVKRYCRDLEEALIRTLAPLGVEATRIEGLTGIWLPATSPAMSPRGRAGPPGAAGCSLPPRKIASIGIHISKWITTHGYALNVDLDPAPFTEWITACGLEDAAFTTIARELGRPVALAEVWSHAVSALEDVFALRLEPASVEPQSLAASHAGGSGS